MANEVIINVKANTDKAKSGLKGIGESLTKVSRAAGIAASAVGAFGVVAIKSFVTASMEQERALATLGQSIENTGVSFDTVKDKILGTTAALQDKTNFGDEQQIRTLTVLTTILGDVDAAMLALPAVMDAASASGLGMESVAKTMGKALAGQVHQAESVGVTFDKTEGFTERLAKVLGKVGGVAEANADPFVQLGNDMGDLKETIGKALIPVLLPLVETLRDFAKRLQEMNPEFVKLIAMVLAGVTAFGLIGGPILLLISMLPALMGGLGMIAAGLGLILSPIGLVVAAVAALAVAWQQNFFGIRDITQDIFSSVAEFMGKVIDHIIKTINGMIDRVNKFGKIFGKEIPHIEEMGDKFKELGQRIKNTAGDYLEAANDWVFGSDKIAGATQKVESAWQTDFIAAPKPGSATSVAVGGQEGAGTGFGGGTGVGGAKSGVMASHDKFFAGINWLMEQSETITGGGRAVSERVERSQWRNINRMDADLHDEDETMQWGIRDALGGG